MTFVLPVKSSPMVPELFVPCNENPAPSRITLSLSTIIGKKMLLLKVYVKLSARAEYRYSIKGVKCAFFRGVGQVII